VIRSQSFVLKLKIVHLEGYLFGVGIFVHLVLVKDHYSPTVVVSLYPYVDFFALDLAFFDFGGFFVAKLLQLLKRVLLKNVELDLR